MTKQFVKSSLQHKEDRHVSLIVKLGGVFLTFSTLVAYLVIIYFQQKPLISPINQFSQFKFVNNYIPSLNKARVIYGFLPYWNLDRVRLNKKLTHVAYFRLAVSGSGEIMVSDDGEHEMGYRKLQSDQFLNIIQELEQNETKLEMVFTIFNGDTATSFLNSQKAQKTFFKNLDSVVLAYPVQGVNLDVEVNATAGAKLKPKFTKFVQETKKHLDGKKGDIKLSVDVYPSASSGKHIWNLEKLSHTVDYVVLMAYDFHRRSSTQAGPVAPLFGGGDIFASDIHGYLKSTVEQVPSNKILLGIPFYGYRWQTVDHSSQSHTYPDTGETVFYSEIAELLESKGVKRRWNSKALSPYLTYKKDGQNYIVYYDDKISIHYKLELVDKLDLGGIAIWALGYEGETEELWQEINQNLSK